MIGQIWACARVIRLLRFPRNKAVLHIDFPGAGTGAIHAMCRAHDLVVCPAVAVSIFPAAVLAGGDAMVARKCFLRVREVIQAV